MSNNELFFCTIIKASKEECKDDNIIRIDVIDINFRIDVIDINFKCCWTDEILLSLIPSLWTLLSIAGTSGFVFDLSTTRRNVEGHLLYAADLLAMGDDAAVVSH